MFRFIVFLRRFFFVISHRECYETCPFGKDPPPPFPPTGVVRCVRCSLDDSKDGNLFLNGTDFYSVYSVRSPGVRYPPNTICK